MPKTVYLYPEVSVYCSKLDTKFPCVKDPNNDTKYLATVNIPPNTGDKEEVYSFEAYADNVATGLLVYVTVGYETVYQYHPVHCVHITPEELDHNGGNVSFIIDFIECSLVPTVQIVALPPSMGTLTRFISHENDIYITGTTANSGIWIFDFNSSTFIKIENTGSNYKFYESATKDIYAYSTNIFYIKKNIVTKIANFGINYICYELKTVPDGNIYFVNTSGNIVSMNKTVIDMIPFPTGENGELISSPSNNSIRITRDIYSTGLIFIYASNLGEDALIPMLDASGSLISYSLDTIETDYKYDPTSKTIIDNTVHIKRYIPCEWLNTTQDFFLINGCAYDPMWLWGDLTTCNLKYSDYMMGDTIFSTNYGNFKYDGVGALYFYNGQLFKYEAGMVIQEEDPYEDNFYTYMQELNLFDANFVQGYCRYNLETDTNIFELDSFTTQTGLENIVRNGSDIYANYKTEDGLVSLTIGYLSAGILGSQLSSLIDVLEVFVLGINKSGQLIYTTYGNSSLMIAPGVTPLPTGAGVIACPQFSPSGGLQGIYISFSHARPLYYLTIMGVFSQVSGMGGNQDSFNVFFTDSKNNVYVSGNNSGVYYLNGTVATEVVSNSYRNYKKWLETSDGLVFVYKTRDTYPAIYRLNKATPGVQVHRDALINNERPVHMIEDETKKIHSDTGHTYDPITDKFIANMSIGVGELNPFGICTWNEPASGSTRIRYNGNKIVELSKRFQLPVYRNDIGTAIDLTNNPTEMLIVKDYK